MKRRVVVTGLGAITPVGNGVIPSWEALKAGKAGIGTISHFDPAEYTVKLAAEVKDFKPEDYMDKREARRMDLFCQYAMAAGSEAMTDAAIDLEKVDRNRFGVLVGSGIGGISTIEQEQQKFLERGNRRVSPLMIPMAIANMGAGQLAIRYGLRGRCASTVTACSSGNDAIGEAFRMIRHGYADYMLCGGAEAPITPLAVAAFNNMQALTRAEDPLRASIPFDKERSGFVIGEGASLMVLETYESAAARGAKIYGELMGYGSTCDAFHITAPEPEGSGGAQAMSEAMADGGVSPELIDYINAHGTSTPLNDRIETAAIKKALGEHAGKVAISSTKSMTGHMLGAAGAFEAMVCILAMAEGFIPPTANYQVPDPECDLDYVPVEGRRQEVNYALSNSLGFGGHNATLLFGKVKD